MECKASKEARPQWEGATACGAWDAGMTTFARISISFMCIAGVWHHAAMSALVQSAWTRVHDHPFVRHDSCEPLVASASFALWVLLFRALDRVPCLARFKLYPAEHCRAKQQGLLKPPSHAVYSLVAYLAPLLVFDSLYPRRRLSPAAPSWPQLQVINLFIHLSSVYVWMHTHMRARTHTQRHACRHACTYPRSPPPSRLLQAELVLGLLVYDFLFFWVHLSFHKVGALGWVRHAQHHRKTPLDATQVVYVYKYSRTHTHARTHARTRARTHTHTHAHTHRW